MANYMAEVAKMLGVEMNKDFECNESDCIYRVTDRGLTCNGCYGADSLMLILNGTFTIKRKPWYPNKNDIFWSVNAVGDTQWGIWQGATHHLTCYKLGNCYPTKEEAVANRDKWVAFYASDEVLEV
jgi:hypothetical protein